MSSTHLLSLVAASIFALGCGSAALAPEAPRVNSPAAIEAKGADDAKAKEEKPADAEEAKAPIASDDKDAAAIAPAAPARKVGDYVVYRFSGSFRKTPLLLTQKVVARKGKLITIELTAEEGKKREALRVTIDESKNNEVTKVARLENGAEKPAGIEAYEQLLARTTLAADENQALVSSEDLKLDVGGTSIACKRTSYRVRVGKHKATLKTIESNAFAWGDVGGEITADSGKTLYRAEVLEAGHHDNKAQVADQDIEE